MQKILSPVPEARTGSQVALRYLRSPMHLLHLLHVLQALHELFVLYVVYFLPPRPAALAGFAPVG